MAGTRRRKQGKKKRFDDSHEGNEWDVIVFNKNEKQHDAETTMLLETLGTFHQLPEGEKSRKRSYSVPTSSKSGSKPIPTSTGPANQPPRPKVVPSLKDSWEPKDWSATFGLATEKEADEEAGPPPTISNYYQRIEKGEGEKESEEDSREEGEWTEATDRKKQGKKELKQKEEEALAKAIRESLKQRTAKITTTKTSTKTKTKNSEISIVNESPPPPPTTTSTTTTTTATKSLNDNRQKPQQGERRRGNKASPEFHMERFFEETVKAFNEMDEGTLFNSMTDEEITSLAEETEKMWQRAARLKQMSQKRVEKNLRDEIDALKAQLVVMRDVNDTRAECKICFEKPINVSLVPCGHRMMCSDCSKELAKRKQRECPMCRKNVQTFVVTYE